MTTVFSLGFFLKLGIILRRTIRVSTTPYVAAQIGLPRCHGLITLSEIVFLRLVASAPCRGASLRYSLRSIGVRDIAAEAHVWLHMGGVIRNKMRVQHGVTACTL